MKRTRQILVLTLVATALCADRVATAAPNLRATSSADPIARLATNLASRLSGSFQRETTAIRLQPVCREGAIVSQPAPRPLPKPVALHRVEGCPFQFRLPPPSL